MAGDVGLDRDPVSPFQAVTFFSLIAHLLDPPHQLMAHNFGERSFEPDPLIQMDIGAADRHHLHLDQKAFSPDFGDGKFLDGHLPRGR